METFNTGKTEEQYKRTTLSYKDRPHKTTLGPSVMSEIMRLCVAQTEQRMLADRKLILFFAFLTKTSNRLCVDAVIQWLFYWCFFCVHMDTVDAPKNCFSWYGQTLAALQRNNICCIFSDTTASDREGPVEFWRTTVFPSLAICIFKTAWKSFRFFFFFLKSSALQKKVRHQMSSRTVLLTKQSRIFTQTSPAAKNVRKHSLQDGNGAELTYIISTYRKKQFSIFD